jgi:hypothetical protein
MHYLRPQLLAQLGKFRKLEGKTSEGDEKQAFLYIGENSNGFRRGQVLQEKKKKGFGFNLHVSNARRRSHCNRRKTFAMSSFR